MTIADTIKSLKTGDRVRVTFEREVSDIDRKGIVDIGGLWIKPEDPTIITVEVLEEPLTVGSRVQGIISERLGEITAIGRHSALVLWDDYSRYEESVLITDLRRPHHVINS